MQAVERNMEAPGVGILLTYKGPSVDDGTMDVYSAASNMMAFSDYVVTATKHLYGDVEVKAEVRGFQQGSFETDLLFHVVGLGSTVLTATPDVQGVLKTVKESFNLFKFLKGSTPEKVEHTDQSNNVAVTNVNGNVIVVQTESLNLVLDEKAGRAAGKFIGEALAKPGMEQVQIKSGDEEVTSARQDEAQFFHAISQETPVMEQTLRMGLTIHEPNFKDGIGHKWTMWDGSVSLQFAMEDQSFVDRIDNGEPFRKGDVLICDVRIVQTRSGSKLRIERTITKVHEHQAGSEQGQMDLTVGE